MSIGKRPLPVAGPNWAENRWLYAMAMLVSYFSLSGNTKRVAETIAEVCEANIEQIEEKRMRKGFFGYLSAGRDAWSERSCNIQPVEYDPRAYDLVVLGTPVWAWRTMPAVRNYLAAHGAQMKRVEFFCTQGASGAEGAFAQMAELCGKQPVASLVVTEGEVKQPDYADKVRSFAESLSEEAF